MARYSASADERDTVLCFFVFHEIGLEPRRTQKPVVDRRVVGHPAQSESQKPFKVSEVDEEENLNVNIDFMNFFVQK